MVVPWQGIYVWVFLSIKSHLISFPCYLLVWTQFLLRFVWISIHFETLFSTQPVDLVVEDIPRNKSVFQTVITHFINQKEKHVSIRHNSILTLMKSGAPFFRIDIMYMIYLDVKYFSVVCLSIYYEKLPVKTALTTTEHLFAS